MIGVACSVCELRRLLFTLWLASLPATRRHPPPPAAATHRHPPPPLAATRRLPPPTRYPLPATTRYPPLPAIRHPPLPAIHHPPLPAATRRYPPALLSPSPVSAVPPAAAVRPPPGEGCESAADTTTPSAVAILFLHHTFRHRLTTINGVANRLDYILL